MSISNITPINPWCIFLKKMVWKYLKLKKMILTVGLIDFMLGILERDLCAMLKMSPKKHIKIFIGEYNKTGITALSLSKSAKNMARKFTHMAPRRRVTQFYNGSGLPKKILLELLKFIRIKLASLRLVVIFRLSKKMKLRKRRIGF